MVIYTEINETIMEFLSLETEEQLEEIAQAKGSNVIFKHNTTCPISKSVIRSFKEEADVLPAETSVYILDLLANRNISDAIAERFNVEHESPQLLLIKDGQCIYNQSLYNISAEETARAAKENS